MSHSVVKDTPTQGENTLVLVVAQDGSISVDQETLDSLINLGSQTTEVSVLRVDQEDGSTVDMTLDTYQPSDMMMDDLTINVDEVQRNYNNFKMDHCYTPLTSPSQRHPIPSDDNNDPDLELDDLAQTLSMLEGSDKPSNQQPTISVSSNIKVSQPKLVPVQKEQKKILPAHDDVKVAVLNKVNKLGVNKVYKGVKNVLNKTQKLVKKSVQHEESDGEDDDLNDSDFELNGSPPKHKINKRTYKRRSKLETSENDNSVKQKLGKVRNRGMKSVMYKNNTPQKTIIQEPKIEPVPIPDPVKPPEVKKIPKKEKKIPKPIIDDGIALFSTPDIIRRVGSGKLGEKLGDSPESPKTHKPAKIEDRSRSDTGRVSTDSKVIKAPQRLSLDSKTSPSPEKIKRDRMSVDSTKLTENKDQELDSALVFPPSIENITPLTDSVNMVIGHTPVVYNNIENGKNIETAIHPTVDEINAIIHTNDVSGVPAPVESSTPLSTGTPTGLEAPILDIDHAILDNINTDELISEDILYQVAKLVENPDLQNAIDRTLVDGSLNLDPAIQQQIAHSQEPASIEQSVTPIPQTLTTGPNLSPKTPTRQVVRSDGRVLVLPPIEKPATRSSKKKTPAEPSAATPRPVPQTQIPIRQPGKVREEGADPETMGSDESDSDESWNSEDDPDRLWCICKQPHNNRFMICCDTCEDWFHGKCVNVTKAMGQQMEQQGKEWMCPNCVKKQHLETTNQHANSNPTSPTPNKSWNSAPGEKSEIVSRRKSVESTTPACIVCGAPSRASSVYCSDQCILKHAQGVERDTKQTQKNPAQRVIVFERATGKCLSGSNAPSAANLKQWLKEHPGFEVVRPVNKNMAQSKLQFVKNATGKGVSLAVNRKGVQIGVLPHTSKQNPTQIRLIPAAKLNVPGMKTQVNKQLSTTSNKPTKLVQSTLKSPTGQAPAPVKVKPVTTPKVEKTLPQKIPQKKPETPTLDKSKAQENIRDNVKKTLFDQLMTRVKEAENSTLTEEEVTKMANDIELQLFKLFGDAGPKYRTKYRSLIFNIKDTKNQTLWKRICDKAIAPAQLVRLSPEELASQELARWRERENKHQLEMIKKSELEMLSINRTYVLKTHKGEQVMEDRPVVQVDSSEIMPGLGADSTSEQDASAPTDKSDASDYSSDRKSSKHSRRDRDRRSSKDRSSESKDKKSSRDHGSSHDRRSRRSRSRDRDRSSHRSDRKRSRSRDRHRSSHKSSRHKRDRHFVDHLDKKSKEILDNLENNKIVVPPEDRLWKHVPQQDIQVATPVDSDSDHEPTSTVTIPTPPRSTDQEEGSHQPLDQNIVSRSHQKHEGKTEASTGKTQRADPRINRDVPAEVAKVETPPLPEPTGDLMPPSPPEKITSQSKETIVWEGNINMIDVAKFFITLHEVSGDCSGLGTELPGTLEIVGRISPDTVWEYIGKMRRSNSKVIAVLRLTAANMEEKMPYIALYSYLSSRSRLGVIKSTNSAVKDFYIFPLASHAPVPQALLPLSGPGFEESRPHLLLGIIVRAKRKRAIPVDIVSTPPVAKRTRVENSPPPVQPTVPTPPARSYTPPPNRDPRIKIPTIPTTNDDDEPYSPEDSDPENTTPVIMTKPRKPPEPAIPDLSAILSSATVVAAATATTTLSASDLSSMLNAAPFKNSSFLDTASALPPFEPFANKFDGIPGLDVDTGVDSLQRKMEELDKCIEKQKEEIRSISQDIASSGAAASMATNLSNISLPSNLQQILDSIKNIPSTTNTESHISTNSVEEYSPSSGYKSVSTASEELTIPLLLPKISSRTQANLVMKTTTKITVEQPSMPSIPLKLPVTPREHVSTPTEENITLPNLSLPPPTTTLPLPNTNIPPPVVLPNLNVPPPINTVQSSSSTIKSSAPTQTIPLNLPKPRPKLTLTPPVVALSPPGTSPVIIPPPTETKTNESKPTSVLSSLSEEELIRKANEMLGETEPIKDTSSEAHDDRQSKVTPAELFSPPVAFKSAPVMYTAPPPVLPNIPPKRLKLDLSQPPVPGMEEEEDNY